MTGTEKNTRLASARYRAARRGLPFAPPPADFSVLFIDRHCGDADFFATIHPLVGGMPMDRAWHSLRWYTEKLLPALA